MGAPQGRAGWNSMGAPAGPGGGPTARGEGGEAGLLPRKTGAGWQGGGEYWDCSGEGHNVHAVCTGAHSSANFAQENLKARMEGGAGPTVGTGRPEREHRLHAVVQEAWRARQRKREE